MKQIAFLFLIIAGATALSCDVHKADIVGRWANLDVPGMGFHFYADGFVKIIEGNVESGGGGFEREGKVVQMKYMVDDSKSPMWLDIVVVEKSTGKEQDRMLGLVEIVDNSTMGMALGFDNGRPTTIDKSSEDYARFKRIE